MSYNRRQDNHRQRTPGKEKEEIKSKKKEKGNRIKAREKKCETKLIDKRKTKN